MILAQTIHTPLSCSYLIFGENWLTVTVQVVTLSLAVWGLVRSYRAERPKVIIDIRDLKGRAYEYSEAISPHETKRYVCRKEIFIVIRGADVAQHVNSLNLEVRHFFKWNKLSVDALDYLFESHLDSQYFAPFELKTGEIKEYRIILIKLNGASAFRAKIECSGPKVYHSKSIKWKHIKANVKGVFMPNPYKESLLSKS
jgi:hypothetical protein